MISFWRIFSLEFVSLMRSRTLAMLTVAGILWMLVFPHVVRSDGTAEGFRELYVQYSLGGVFVLLVVSLLAASAGSIAREREAKRLQLTLVRPVRRCVVVLGRIAAQVMAGAIVLALACGLLACRTELSARCSHVLSPVLPSPAEEAKAMYESYMNDPETPQAVKRAKKDVVLRLLARRAVDHYQTVPTNDTVVWKFDGAETRNGTAVRMRFTNPMEMRQDVIGDFHLGNLSASVSNITQAVLEIPLHSSQPSRLSQPSQLLFFNRGKSALMLRPRKDVNLLVPADVFGWNLLRAYVVMLSVLALLVSLGQFLSASLSRPVALFVAFAVLAVGEMSPSVLEQYPDELETKTLDRIGLVLTRAVSEVTRPVSALSPLGALAKNECIERETVVHAVALNLVFLPVVLSLLAAFVLPRKQES